MQKVSIQSMKKSTFNITGLLRQIVNISEHLTKKKGTYTVTS